MTYQRYELKRTGSNDNDYMLVVYLNNYSTEFADELGRETSKRKDLVQTVRQIVKERYPNLKVSVIKVMIGGMAITSIPLMGAGDHKTEAAELEAPTSQVSQESSYSYYVSSGDTLYSIAKKFNTSVDSIKKANNLTSNALQVNQPLMIPKAFHTVASGDTLYSLASTYKTSVDMVKRVNGLTNNTITMGQQLIIPNSITETVSTSSEVEVTTPVQTSSYKVDVGDSLWTIANRFGVSVSAIKQANHLTSDLLQIGQTLSIPATKEDALPTVSIPTTKNVSYTVVSGDSLWAIANRFEVSVNDIRNSNNLESDLLQVGQKLVIPKEEGAVLAPALTPATNFNSTHTVKTGDTLYSIARKYNVTVDQLKTQNQLTNNTLQIGQVLTVNKTEPVTAKATTNEDSSIEKVQENLKKLGYYDVPTMTGSYDTSTTSALKNFQSDYGLVTSGKADSATLTAIDHAVVKQAIIKDSVNYTGVPYLWGGTTPTGFDCSGFVYFMFQKHGVEMSRNTSSGLYKQGTTIADSDLMPGDLVFFSTSGSGITHVGFYMGDNQFISATSSSGIKAVSMDNSYWSKHYVGAKRLY
ncbi:C40 family peptidase [Salirhabdus sp. Marseille-P4669]|uniref:C40 family peptidase n=1 Tax=Salirhabdus sp. Marseille-P4669 TaxID=2042310 RepID=UPI0013580D27|nr:LysM peptidoglycan-binding domain-containing protein [Salirhabdus sp. Marseille-P4669]